MKDLATSESDGDDGGTDDGGRVSHCPHCDEEGTMVRDGGRWWRCWDCGFRAREASDAYDGEAERKMDERTGSATRRDGSARGPLPGRLDGEREAMRMMKKTKTTGQTCVGDLRLTPLDVGFDPRALGMAVALPTDFASVGIEENGETYLVEGTREEMIAAIRAAGCRVVQMPLNPNEPEYEAIRILMDDDLRIALPPKGDEPIATRLLRKVVK